MLATYTHWSTDWLSQFATDDACRHRAAVYRRALSSDEAEPLCDALHAYCSSIIALFFNGFESRVISVSIS